MDLPDPDRPRASSRLTVSRTPFPSLGSPFSREETRDMKTILLTIAAGRSSASTAISRSPHHRSAPHPIGMIRILTGRPPRVKSPSD